MLLPVSACCCLKTHCWALLVSSSNRAWVQRWCGRQTRVQQQWKRPSHVSCVTEPFLLLCRYFGEVLMPCSEHIWHPEVEAFPIHGLAQLSGGHYWPFYTKYFCSLFYSFLLFSVYLPVFKFRLFLHLFTVVTDINSAFAFQLCLLQHMCAGFIICSASSAWCLLSVSVY